MWRVVCVSVCLSTTSTRICKFTEREREKKRDRQTDRHKHRHRHRHTHTHLALAKLGKDSLNARVDAHIHVLEQVFH